MILSTNNKVGRKIMAVKMKEIPSENRPRERLLKYGVESLSNQELLMIILKTGAKEKSVQEVALELLMMFGSLYNLRNMTVSKVSSIKGIGKIKAIELISCLELGKRIFLEEQQSSKKIVISPKVIWKDSLYLFFGKKQEYFYCFYLNNKQELIERKLLFMGTLNRSVVHPREIFKEAYLLSASSIICLHNHPSNDVRPSSEDIRFTNSLVEIGKIQGIPVIDHIIVGETGYYSFYESHNI